MATQRQVDELMQLFAGARPAQTASWQRRRTSAATGSDGMLGVLLYLYRTEGAVTAGMISKAMRITTGRVTALTKKMVEKGLITREPGTEDARVTEIALTEKGRKVVEDLQSQRNAQMRRLIDTVGMDRLRDYIETSKQVWEILTPLSPNL